MASNSHHNLESSLRERLQTLEARIEDINRELEAPGDDDFAESATESEGDETLVETRRTAEQEIAQIRRALKRMEEGRYGTCEACGTDIPAPRLKALPFATRCVNCA